MKIRREIGEGRYRDRKKEAREEEEKGKNEGGD